MPDFLPEEVRRGRKPVIAAGPSRQGGLRSLEMLIDDILEGGGEELYAESLAMLEKYLFTRVLSHTGGNQSQAAKILGITRGSLRNKIRLLKISIGQVVSVEDEEDEEQGAPVASHANGE